MGCLYANVANECTLIRTKTTTGRNKQTKHREQKKGRFSVFPKPMLVRFCVDCITVFSFFLNASFGYVNQHRMCQKITVLQHKYVKCQNLFSFCRWLCRNDLISAISFSRHSKLSGCEECSALLTLEYWWPLKIRVSNLLWCQFYFNNIILRMQDSWRRH